MNTLKDFDPRNKIFHFHFADDECFRKAYGVCSLDLSQEEADKYEDIGKIRNPHRCRYIYKAYKDGSYMKDIPSLTLNSCGHFSFNEGRHRVCVASKKNLQIEAVIYNHSEICPSCYFNQNNKKEITTRQFLFFKKRVIIEKDADPSKKDWAQLTLL